MAPRVSVAILTCILPWLLTNITFVATDALPPITLRYEIFEEIPVGTMVGNLKEDAGLIGRYTRNQLSFLRFRFLMQPLAPVELDTVSGELTTNGRLDREQFCPRLENCELSIDIAIQPIQYFQIIKISFVIADINDNEPTFDETEVRFTLPESIAVGKSLALPVAQDSDSPKFNIRSYDLAGGNEQFGLQVEQNSDLSTSLKLVIEESLDREVHASYHLQIVSKDYGNLLGMADVYIEVQDVNDNNPVFRNNSYRATVPENIAIGSTILRVEAYDPDLGANGQVTYTFSQHTLEKFGHIVQLQPKTGEIIIRDVLDYEENKVLHLAIIANDGGANTLPAETFVQISVVDFNDNAPNVTINTLTGTAVGEVSEDATVGTFVAHFSVIDRDSGVNGQFDCFLRHANFGLSKLYASEYQIVTTSGLDRETRSRYDVSIECIDNGAPHRATVTFFQIVVTDANDNAPDFDQSEYEISLYENNAVGRSLLQVSASDRDVGPNAQITYSLEPRARPLFTIEVDSGRIFSAISYDREQYPEGVIEFMVLATDNGLPALASSVTIRVVLLDENDQPPRFLQDGYSFGVFENDEVGVSVGQVAATDRDKPPYNKIRFSMEASSFVHHHFEIDPDTGVIHTSQTLDRETMPTYHLSVVARDAESPHLSSTCSVSIYVSDLNDNDPEFVFPNVFNNSVDLPSNAPSLYAVTRIRAKDADLGENAQIQYKITAGNDNSWFKLDQDYGILSTTEAFYKAHLDMQSISLRLLVRDRGETPRSHTATLIIHIVEPVAALNAQVVGSNDFLSSDNLTIVISLAVISLAVTIILVVAIVLIYKRMKARKAHAQQQQYGQYNCRTEAMRMWVHNNDSRASDEHTLTHEMYAMHGSSLTMNGSARASTGYGGEAKSSSCSHADRNGTLGGGGGRSLNSVTVSAVSKKEVSFNLDGACEFDGGCRPGGVGGGGGELHEQSLRSTIDSHTLKNPRAQSSALTSQSTLPGTQPVSPVSARQAEQRQLEVARLLDMLRRGEYETTSVVSEEDSTCDSGRGPSEEGAQTHANVDTARAESLQRLRAFHQELHSSAAATVVGGRKSPDPQVVPSISNQTTPRDPASLSLSVHQPSTRSMQAYRDARNPDTVSKELAKLEKRASPIRRGGVGGGTVERLQSASSERVHSDCALLRGELDVAAMSVTKELPSRECTCVSTTPGTTPTAVWRKETYSPSSCYASYLDYKYPKSPKLSLPNKNNLSDSMILKSPGSKVDLDRESPKRVINPERNTFSPTGVDIDKSRLAVANAPRNAVQGNENQNPANSQCSIDTRTTPTRQTQSNNVCIRDLSPVAKVDSPTVNGSKQAPAPPTRKTPRNDSQLSDTTLECTDNGLLYSCADMTDLTALKTPATVRGAPVQNGGGQGGQKSIDLKVMTSQLVTPSYRYSCDLSELDELNDNCSTTSGSYVVDPQDLCQQIDQIFFNESQA